MQDGECMKDLMIGTNSAVEVLETGGFDVGFSLRNEPSKGATDVLKRVSWRDLVSSGYDVLNTEKLSPVIRESHDSSARKITKMTHHEWVNQCISHAV